MQRHMIMMHLPLIEGVLLRSEHGFAAAVRRPTGEIVLRKGSLPGSFGVGSHRPTWFLGWQRAWQTFALWWSLWRWALEQNSPDPAQQLASATLDHPRPAHWQRALPPEHHLSQPLYRGLLAWSKLPAWLVGLWLLASGWIVPWLLTLTLRSMWLQRLPLGSKRYCWLLWGVALVCPVLFVAAASLCRPAYRCLAYQLGMMLVLEQAEDTPKAFKLPRHMGFARRWSATTLWYVAQVCALPLLLGTWHVLSRRWSSLMLLVAHGGLYVLLGVCSLTLALALRQLVAPTSLNGTHWYAQRAVWHWPMRWLWPQPDEKQIAVALVACRALCEDSLERAVIFDVAPLAPVKLADACARQSGR